MDRLLRIYDLSVVNKLIWSWFRNLVNLVDFLDVINWYGQVDDFIFYYGIDATSYYDANTVLENKKVMIRLFDKSSH